MSINTEASLIASGKRLKELRRTYKKQIECVQCGIDVVARTPIRKYCDTCVKKISYRKGKDKDGKYQFTSRKRSNKPAGAHSEWVAQRLKTVLRDKGTCRICDENIGKSIAVHHIDENGYSNSDNPNNVLSNLICLCNRCHRTITSMLYHLKHRPEKRELLKHLLNF